MMVPASARGSFAGSVALHVTCPQGPGSRGGQPGEEAHRVIASNCSESSNCNSYLIQFNKIAWLAVEAGFQILIPNRI